MDRLEIMVEIAKTLIANNVSWENENSFETNVVESSSLITEGLIAKDKELAIVEEEQNDNAEISQIMLDNEVHLNRDLMEHNTIPALTLPTIAELAAECEDCDHEIIEEQFTEKALIEEEETEQLSNIQQAKPIIQPIKEDKTLW